jgi:hypothetical protein
MSVREREEANRHLQFILEAPREPAVALGLRGRDDAEVDVAAGESRSEPFLASARSWFHVMCSWVSLPCSTSWTKGRRLPIMFVDTKKQAGRPSERRIGAAIVALSW